MSIFSFLRYSFPIQTVKPDEVSKSISNYQLVTCLLLVFFPFFFFFNYPLADTLNGHLKFKTNHSVEQTVEMSPGCSLQH